MNQNQAETPIFTRASDFIAWLVPVTNHFPRSHRHTVTKRLLDGALNLLECLVEANNRRSQARRRALEAADEELDKVRFYLRLAYSWRWLSPGQYEHAGRMVAEIGRLLGGWQKLARQQSA